MTEDFLHLERGLIARGFVGTNKIDSIGYCNKNEKHFILRTDGLVIYTNYYDTHESYERLKKNDYKYYWDMGDFSFKELEEVMSIVDF